MKKWWIKCFIQLVLSHIPMGERINHLLRGKEPYEHLEEWTLKQAIRHVEMLKQTNINISNEIVLEIGPGWKPIFPFIFRASGCRRVLLCDLNRYLDRKLLTVTINQMKQYIPMISELLKINKSEIEKVLLQVSDQSFETLLEECGFEYKAPFDVRSTDLPDDSIGIVTSRATLEHIPPQDLREIFKEMRRIIKPFGAMVHTIDHSDHWQHFDPSISRINLLKFPDWWWNIICVNNLVYQNRLRSYEYVDMIKDTGFRILYVNAIPDKQVLEDIRGLKLIKRYQETSPEKVAILTTYIVAQPI
jgi:SAM-dependent methyltransferase